MQNYLFPLSSFNTSWLSSNVTSWLIKAILALLCSVGLYFLLLPNLQHIPSLPPSKKRRHIKTHHVKTQGRSRRRRRSGALKACRDHLGKLEEAQGPNLLLQTHLGQVPGQGNVHQLSCQDFSGEVWETAPAEAHLPCEELIDNAAPTVSPLASTAPLTKPPLPLASTLPPGLATPFFPVLSHSPLSASWPPETFLLLDHLSPRPFALSLPPPYLPCSFACLQPPTAFSAPPLPESTLTLSHCDLMALPLSTSPYDNSWLASPDPTTSDLNRSSHPVPAFWWQTAAKALFFPTSTHCESQQEQLSHHPPKDSFWGGPVMRHTKAGSPYFFSPDVQKSLEIQVMKRVEFKIWKENEKDGSFLKPMSLDYHLNSLENKIKALGEKQGTTVPQPFWSTKDKPEQLLSPQQLSYHITLQDHLKEKYSQLFWGLPSLHSESLVATAWVSESSSPLHASSFLFNSISNSYPVQMQTKASSLLSQYQPHSESQSQPLIPNMPQSQPPFLSQMHSQPPPLAHVQTQAHLQSSLPALLPSSIPQIKASGEFCSTAQNKTRSVMSTGSQSLEWSSLQEQVENGCSLSSVVNRSQEPFSSLNYNLSQDSHPFWDHRSVSTIPEKLPLSLDLHKQLEQHLQQRLTQHHWGLPSRIHQSLELMQPQGKSPGACKAKDNHGRSWPTMFTSQSSKDDKNLGFRHPESTHVTGPREFQLGKDLGGVPIKNTPKGLESCPLKVLRTDPEKKLKDVLMRHMENHFPRLSDQKQRENALIAHLGTKWWQINEGRIPVRVRRSRLAVNDPLPKSDARVKTRNLASSKGWKCHVNTSQEISFLKADTQKVLEAHSKRFWVKHKWDIPLKVLKPIKLFKARKAQAPPPQQSILPASSTHKSGARIAEIGKVLGEKLQMHQQEKVTTKSVSTLDSPLPAPFFAFEEIQKVLIQTPPCDGHGLSEAPLTGQEGRQPPQPLTSSIIGRPWESRIVLGPLRGSLEPTPCQAITENVLREESGSHTPGVPSHGGAMLWTDIGSQSPRAEESREAIKADWCPAFQPQSSGILRTSELANSQILNVDLSGLRASGTNQSSTTPRTSAAQVPGQPCPIEQVVNEPEIKVKVKPENEPQDGPTDVLLATDSPASQVPECRPRSTTRGNRLASHVLDGSMKAGGSREGQQGCRAPLKSQGKMFAPSDEQEDHWRPKPKEDEERVIRFRIYPTRRVGQLAQVRGEVDTVGSKYLHILPEKAQAPPESRFKKRMRHLLQWIFPSQKGKGQESEPTSVSAQSRWPGKCGSFFTDSGDAEAQALMMAVGQMLETKMALHASELGQHSQRTQARAGECSCYLLPKASFSPGQRRGMCALPCCYRTRPKGQGSPNREGQVREQSSTKIVRFYDDCLGSHQWEQPPPSPLPGIRSLGGVQRCWSWVPGAPACPHHCPRHCLWGGILSPPPEGASPGSSSSKTSL